MNEAQRVPCEGSGGLSACVSPPPHPVAHCSLAQYPVFISEEEITAFAYSVSWGKHGRVCEEHRVQSREHGQDPWMPAARELGRILWMPSTLPGRRADASQEKRRAGDTFMAC